MKKKQESSRATRIMGNVRTIKDLESRMEELAAQKAAQVDAMDAEETSLNEELATIKKIRAGSVIGKKRGRPSKSAASTKVITPKAKNYFTLSEMVKKVMKSGKAMKVKDIAQAVKDAGYVTKNTNDTYFASSVNKILRDDKGFKKVDHGTFQAKTVKASKTVSKVKGQLVAAGA